MLRQLGLSFVRIKSSSGWNLDQSLTYDHVTPRADLKTSVGNYSRQVTFSTENPDTTALHRRGHVMFVHHAEVDVRYAAFWHLERTDKSRPTFEAGDIADSITATSNVRARYPVHFHRSGLDDVGNLPK